MNTRHIVITSCLLAACVTAQISVAETLSQKLKRQTQEFSDAGHEGNKAVLDRYLDPNVIFIGEDGSVSNKKDVVEGASAPQPGITMAIKVTDWAMRRHGDVAVATFVDHLTENFFGQPLDFDYRSTEVWKLEGDQWRMIASQTLTMQRDPLAMPLPAETLQDYVGTYKFAPQLTVKITRTENKIFAALNDGTPAELKAEARDVLFIPGQPGRKIFERDDQGRVTGYRNRHDGRDIIVTKVLKTPQSPS